MPDVRCCYYGCYYILYVLYVHISVVDTLPSVGVLIEQFELNISAHVPVAAKVCWNRRATLAADLRAANPARLRGAAFSNRSISPG